MSDQVTRDAIARGKPISAKRAAALLAELEAAQAQTAQWQEANSLAAQTLVQKDARIAALETALRQAGHADSCALQYGGACDCRMQLVRRGW
jgi:hypothetical protein